MKERKIFFCTDCGNETAKWQGQCPACGSWNTIAERPAGASALSGRRGASAASRSALLSDAPEGGEIRFGTGSGELDRVMGGGAVRGSLVLFGGEPGVGKSTLLLQICRHICVENKVLYISGEESPRQLNMRARRLGVDSGKLFALPETNLESILGEMDAMRPDVVIVDSIQTLYAPGNAALPGNVAQVRECAMALMQAAKADEITVFLVGHVNKEGSIAGPKVLEHMVDCVLYFEGERHLSTRILRARKNRFGSTNEIGVFEMRGDGLRDVPNPSGMLLSERPKDVPGTCVACVMEGSRPVLSEIQALVAPSGYGQARRMSAGIDYNRAMLLLAVLEKRAGMTLANCDAYINVVGGLNIDEPAADLPTVMAVASSVRDRPVPFDTAAFGEVGLTGEIRSVSAPEQRIAEIRRMGFARCVVPYRTPEDIAVPEGLEVVRAKNIREALGLFL